MSRHHCSFLLVLGLLFGRPPASAQGVPGDPLEELIRRLDGAEADALLRRDSTALRNIWAPDLTVNNPRNSVTRGSDEVIALIRNGTIDYASFVRDIETIVVHGDAVIVMGAETLTPVRRAPRAGETLRRRFTHVWMRRDGAWRLTARHAHIICPP